MLVAKSPWLSVSAWLMNYLRALFIPFFFIEKDGGFRILLCTF